MLFCLWQIHSAVNEKQENDLLQQEKIEQTVSKTAEANPLPPKLKKPIVPELPCPEDNNYEKGLLVIREVEVTAYDLSVQSCGKPIGSKGYGITASGYNLSNKSRIEARTIAVDPRIIPMGKEVRVSFADPKMKKYDGIYVARDTGGAVKGYKIDLFMGDFRSHQPAAETINFGVQKAKATVFL